MVNYSGAWRYRHFIFSSVRAEFASRFARSRLGGLWAVIHPLTQVMIYALILSGVLSSKMPGIDNRFSYAIYLCAGQLGWNLFSEIITRSLTIFIDNANLLKKISFPRITLPLIALGTSLVNNGLLLASIILVFAVLGHFPGMAMVWLPVLAIVTISLALGVGLVLGVLNIFMRDIGQAVPTVLQILYWFTPIVYPITIIPESKRGWLALNPVYPVVAGFQDVLVYGQKPSPLGLLAIMAVSCVILAFALALFRRASGDMLDVL